MVDPEAVQPRGVVLDAMGEVHKWPYPIKYGEETEVVAYLIQNHNLS